MSEPVAARSKVEDWLGLIRFSHTIFALPFAALATVMAFATPLPSGLSPTFRIRDVLGIVLCMVMARSAAMAFNRLVDAQIDAANPRTAGRHLPAGVLGRGQVWAFTFACAIGFVASTLLFLPNPLPLWLAVPVLLFLCGYSLAKRFTSAGASLVGSRPESFTAVRLGSDSGCGIDHGPCGLDRSGSAGRRRCRLGHWL